MLIEQKKWTMGLFGRFIGLSALGCMVVFFLLFGVYEYSRYQKKTSSLDNKLNTLLDAYAILLSEPLAEAKYEQIYLHLAGLTSDPDVLAVQVLDAQGMAIAEHEEPADDSPVIAGEVGIQLTQGALRDEVGRLQIELTRDRIQKELVRDSWISVSIFVGLLLASTLASAFAYWRAVGSPLSRLTRAIEDFESHGYHQDVPVHSMDQLGKVTEAYNKMQHRVAAQRRALVKQQVALEDQVDARTSQLAEELERHAETSQRLAHNATHDGLTGLPNRRALEDIVSSRLGTNRPASKVDALCFVDLDRFKVINDSAGHLAGDSCLQSIAAIMRDMMKPGNSVARYGGDEFGILLINTDAAEAEALCNKLIERVDEFRFSWRDKQFRLGMSVGITLIRQGDATFDYLLTEADMACYIAKKSGGNRVHVHTDDDPKMKEERRTLYWASEISTAIDSDQLELWMQPIVPADKNTNEGWCELLLRYRSSAGNIVSPADFLPVVERQGLIGDIDRWVLDRVVQLLNEPPSEELPHRFSINISGQSASDEHFSDYALNKIGNYVQDPSRICIEITETTEITNLKNARYFMDALNQLGCTFALDDFGAGTSSFEYLRHLNFNILKIDGSYIRSLDTDKSEIGMLSCLTAVGEVMGLKTVGEFVENDNIAQIVKTMNIDYLQGYFIGMPEPLSDDLMARIRRPVGD